MDNNKSSSKSRSMQDATTATPENCSTLKDSVDSSKSSSKSSSK